MKRRLNVALAEWKERLGLRDWQVEVSLCCASELHKRAGAEVVGICFPTYELMHAKIYLLARRWTEGDLVHELLHCLIPVQSDAGYQTLQEQGIERIAQALCHTRSK